MREIQIKVPAPILNTPDFSFAFGGSSGAEIPLNERGLPFCFEWVALSGMKFQVAEEIVSKEKNLIYRVVSSHYPSDSLYLDARFTKESIDPIESLPLPSKEKILSEMRRLIGTPYVWGGNWNVGISEMLTYYPPKGPIDEKTRLLWTLQGVDCSGLLFQIMNGSTPRNTSTLVHFGKDSGIEGSCLDQILNSLEPLDMIVYPGHILFVLDSDHTIESRFPIGVIQTNIKERLAELLEQRKVVSRWNSNLDRDRSMVIRRFPY